MAPVTDAATRLRQGNSIAGTMLRIAVHPALAPMAKDAGLDFVMLDMEHGPCSFESLAALASAARPIGLGAWVRVPELTRGNVSRALDCGAGGVMVPMIEEPEQARALAAWSKYPPLGGRGLSSVGGHTDYRKIGGPAQMMSELNRRTLTIAQIETKLGAQNAEQIAAVEGIDVLLIGPNDLSLSLGTPEDMNSELMQTAVTKIAKAAKNNGKILGMHADAAMLERWIPHGVRLIMHSLDINILRTGLKNVKETIQNVLPKEVTG